MADSPAYPGAPRWVKVVGAISVALAAVFVAVHLAGGGFHHAHGSSSSSPGAEHRAGE
jgi:hypothetical protein